PMGVRFQKDSTYIDVDVCCPIHTYHTSLPYPPVPCPGPLLSFQSLTRPAGNGRLAHRHERRSHFLEGRQVFRRELCHRIERGMLSKMETTENDGVGKVTIHDQHLGEKRGCYEGGVRRRHFDID